MPTRRRFSPPWSPRRKALKEDAELARAELSMAQERYRDALGTLEPLAGSNSAETALRTAGLMAVCLMRTGQTEKARQLHGDWESKQPAKALAIAVREQLAEAAYAGGEFGWAESLFGSLAADEGAGVKVSVLAGLAWSQFRSGKPSEAAATFGRLLQRDPPAALAAEVSLARGQAFEKLGRSDPALAMYDRVIQRHASTPQYAAALGLAARLRHKLHQDREAAALFERLVREHPALPDMDAVLYQWAWALSDSGCEAEAAELFQRVHANHRASAYWADATFRLAQRAFTARDYFRARDLLTPLLDDKVEAGVRRGALFLRAQVAGAEEDWGAAEECFGKVASDAAGAAGLRRAAEYGGAEALFRQGKQAEAAERFRRLVDEADRLEPAVAAMSRLRLAQSLCRLKRWEEARGVAARIAEKHPAFEEQYEADYVLGRCLAQRADFEGAREAYSRVLRSAAGAKTQTAANAQLMIAESYFHQKLYEQALGEYLKVEAYSAFPAEQAASLVQAGKCHELLGQPEEAMKFYRRVAAEHPANSLLREAAGLQQQLAARRRQPDVKVQ